MTSDNGMRSYYFSSFGGKPNLEVQVAFNIHQDESWFEIHRKFVDFLQANGFVFDLKHPIRSVGNGY